MGIGLEELESGRGVVTKLFILLSAHTRAIHKGRQHPHRMLLPFWAGQLDVHCLGPSKRTGLLFLSLTDTIFLEKRFPHFIPKEQSIRGVQPCTSSRFFVYSKCARYKSKHESLLNKRSRNSRVLSHGAGDCSQHFQL